jgi:hypothetical protein
VTEQPPPETSDGSRPDRATRQADAASRSDLNWSLGCAFAVALLVFVTLLLYLYVRGT